MKAFSFAGIDEAALGPILGPYIGGMSYFTSSSEQLLYKQFKPLLSPSDKTSPFRVEDSKKLYTSGKGIGPLEENILPFILCHYDIQLPITWEKFLKTICIDPISLRSLLEEPWYQTLKKNTLPMVSSIEDIIVKKRRLYDFMTSKNIHMSQLCINLADIKNFNNLLHEHQNKAVACREILKPLFTVLPETANIMVDRQGGRSFYQPWLSAIYPEAFILILEEKNDFSSYKVNEQTISFQVKADDLHFEVALASMLAKYTREGIMTAFNQYWKEKLPNVKPTAGYPQDGKRFISDLTNNKALPSSVKNFIREK